MAPSGRGKTTLLRCIAGLERPDSGQITDLPERIGYVFQEDRLCDGFSAVDNIRLVTGRAMDEGEICRHLKDLGLAGQPGSARSGSSPAACGGECPSAGRCALAPGFCCWTSPSMAWMTRLDSRRRTTSCGIGAEPPLCVTHDREDAGRPGRRGDHGFDLWLLAIKEPSRERILHSPEGFLLHSGVC